MCVVGFQWHPGSPEPLLILGNRDEYYERPTAPLAWWEGGRILAGRDLQAGGTWLGVTRAGRVAVLTNFRDPTLIRPNGPSRGQLPVRFLEGDASASAFLEVLRPEAASYSPFNLLLYDGEDLLGYESRGDRVVRFEPGVHAVSNGAFDEPWPKVERLKEQLAQAGNFLRCLAVVVVDQAGHHLGFAVVGRPAARRQLRSVERGSERQRQQHGLGHWQPVADHLDLRHRHRPSEEPLRSCGALAG